MHIYNGFLLSRHILEHRLDMATAQQFEPQLNDDLLSRFTRLDMCKIKVSQGHEGEPVVNFTLTLDGQPAATHVDNPYGALPEVTYHSDAMKQALDALFDDTLMVSLKEPDSPFSDEALLALPDLRDMLICDLAIAAHRIKDVSDISKKQVLFGSPVVDIKQPVNSDLYGMQWGNLSIKKMLADYGDEGRDEYQKCHNSLIADMARERKIALAPVSLLKDLGITLSPVSLPQ